MSLNPDVEMTGFLYHRRSTLDMVFNRYGSALTFALLFLKEAGTNRRRKAEACMQAMEILDRQNALDQALDMAETGLEAALSSKDQRIQGTRASLFAYQALLYQKKKMAENARSAHEHALVEIALIGSTLQDTMYEGLCGYYALIGNFGEALRWQQRQFAEANNGMSYYQFKAALAMLKLQLRAGMDTTAMVLIVQDVMTRLNRPEWYQAKLNGALKGDYLTIW